MGARPRGERTRRKHQWGFSLTVLGVTAFVVSAGAASVVTELDSRPPVEVAHGSVPRQDRGAIPGPGALVPAYDLSSDPVFPTLSVGYAIESHKTGAGQSEHLARSLDGGRRWYLAGASFPFAAGYAEVQFISVLTGYAFGPAGLAVTHDGGSTWQAGASLGGTLERIIPIGDNVWATYAVCHGPPEAATPCNVRLAVSKDGGLRWHTAARGSPLTEAISGGDVLARDTLDEAYVVSYGVSGGGLAMTPDSGRTWRRLPDPCSKWRTVDMAVLSGGQLWMICGGAPVLGGTASAKAVLRSYDYGERWVLQSSTGFGPPIADLGAGAKDTAPTRPAGPGHNGRSARGRGVVGQLWYSGQLSELATISPVTAWIGVSGVGVLVSFDSGKNWQLATDMRASEHGVGVGVTFNDAVHGWAIDFHQGVWATSDGVHWRLLDGT
ncbi:MAG: sialidase family protein [Acidimicrobiales bacterium]